VRTATAAEVRALREDEGMGMEEARQVIAQRHALAVLDSPFWFFHLRTLIRYLITRTPK
jgi:hypothetical protein